MTVQADERTPLLATEEPVLPLNDAEVVVEAEANGNGTVNGNAKTGDEDDVPLPMGQVVVLCIASLVDPIAFFCIFPFVPKMVETMNVAEADVGFYTGLIESLASLTQMLTMFYWGKAADRYGRKPILLISNLGVATFTLLFGTSSTLWQMIVYRSLSGVFTGSLVAVRAMFQEISTTKTRARAFSYFAFARNVGIFIGPALGSLARPAEQYPDVFGHIEFFRKWPYILPTAIGSSLGFIAAVSSLLFLKETLPEELKNKDGKPSMTAWELLKHRGVPIALLNYLWATMLGMAYTAMAPVFYFTSVKLGGLGFSESMIALFISISGISQAIWLLVVFPPVNNKLGTKRLLQYCGLFWGFFMISMSIANLLLRKGLTTVFWIFAPINQVLGSAVAMAFTGVQLALNDAAPSPELLGTLNGIALTIQPGVRALAPSLFASLYAFGVKHRILGGQLGIVILTVMAASYFFIASALPEDQPPAKNKPSQSADEEE